MQQPDLQQVGVVPSMQVANNIGANNINAEMIPTVMPVGMASVKLCRFFKQGICTKGSTCRFSHDNSLTEDVTPCRYYQRGSCTYGDRCCFAHIGAPRPPATASNSSSTPDSASAADQPASSALGPMTMATTTGGSVITSAAGLHAGGAGHHQPHIVAYSLPQQQPLHQSYSPFQQAGQQAGGPGYGFPNLPLNAYAAQYQAYLAASYAGNPGGGAGGGAAGAAGGQAGGAYVTGMMAPRGYPQ